MAVSTLPSKPAGAGPSNTLYCSNLPDKLQKEDLKKELYIVFSVHGPILDIVALKTSKMRGQAHIVFRDIQSSTQAMRALQDQDLCGKPIKITYASKKSDTLAKLDGTYKQPQPQSQPNAPVASEDQKRLQAAISGVQADKSAPVAATNGTTTMPKAAAALKVPDGDVPSPSSQVSQGVKRPRDDSEDVEVEEEAPMDMDDDAMEESDDD